MDINLISLFNKLNNKYGLLLKKIFKISFLISLFFHPLYLGIRIGVDVLKWEISEFFVVKYMLGAPLWTIVVGTIPLIIGLVLFIKFVWNYRGL